MEFVVSIAIYVLQALGLYTIANRRGIQNPWLAWIPLGAVWILGSIHDDYMARRGQKKKLRVAILALYIAIVVLSAAVLTISFTTLLNVLSEDEIMEILNFSINPSGDLYTPSEEELFAQITEKLETRLTNEMADSLVEMSLVVFALSLAFLGVFIAAFVLECICVYNVFESCEPSTKLMYFLIGLFVNLWPVFLFIVRNKDLGLPQGPVGLPGGFDRQEPWNV